MAKNYELIVNTDFNESFSSKSDNSQEKDIDFETEEEKKNRISLQNALESNNNSKAFAKIDKNISLFCSNIKKIQDYSLFLGSKQDNQEKGMEIDKIIIETANKIAETFTFIEIIQNFEYKDRNQKIQIITKANRLEEECNKYKKLFDDLTDKIKQQNLNLIKQARTSIRYSNFSDFSGEIHINNENNLINDDFKNGKEFLEGIEMKRKQNNAIYKAAKKIKNSLSKKNVTIFNDNINNKDNKEDNENKYNKNNRNDKYNKDDEGNKDDKGNKNDKYNIDNNNKDDNKIEIFNIEYNKKNDLKQNLLTKNSTNKQKNNAENNKFVNIINDTSRRTSVLFHDMENNVFIALEGKRTNGLKRHWFISLIFIILIISLLYYFFFFKKK